MFNNGKDLTVSDALNFLFHIPVLRKDFKMYDHRICSELSQSISFMLHKQKVSVQKAAETFEMSPEDIATCILCYPIHFFYPYYFSEDGGVISFEQFLNELRLLQVDLTKLDLNCFQKLNIKRSQFSYPVNFIYWAVYTNDIDSLEIIYSEYANRGCLGVIKDMLDHDGTFSHKNEALDRLKVLYYQTVLEEGLRDVSKGSAETKKRRL